MAPCHGHAFFSPRLILAAAIMVSLAACGSVRETLPSRAATEQLLISKAADQAADAVAQIVPADRAVFLDSSNFEGTDSKYAIAAVRDSILRRGARLAPDKDKADIVVEIRAGALSVDKTDSLVGLPSMNLPIPLTQNLETPEVAIYKDVTTQGVAKLAATAYDSKSGALVASSGPRFGYSHRTEKTLLLFINWTSTDYQPEKETPLSDLAPDKILHDEE